MLNWGIGKMSLLMNTCNVYNYVCTILCSRFVYLKGCGCVISEKALKEVPSKTCHKVDTTEAAFRIFYIYRIYKKEAIFMYYALH